jgi:hypothetical protein
MATKIEQELSPKDARAKQLILEASQQIFVYKEKIKESNEEIKEIKKYIKNEGISMKAFNKAFSEFLKLLEDPNEKHERDVADIYLEVMEENSLGIVSGKV